MNKILITCCLILLVSVCLSAQNKSLEKKYAEDAKDCRDPRFKGFLKLTPCQMLDFVNMHFGTTKKRRQDKYKQMYYFIGIIEEETDIDSSCHADIGGYLYFKQQHFINDIRKWRLYFGCKKD